MPGGLRGALRQEQHGRYPCAYPAMRSPLILTALVLSVLAPGCASGGNGGADAGRRDAPLLGPDVPGRDAPLPDAPLPDVPGIDAPSADVPMTIVRDTGVDAPRPDTPGVDAPPECVVAADCNDGNACDGIERCEFGRCVEGVPPVCDDGVACTTDACAGAGCTYTPVSSRCNDGVACTTDTCTASGCTAVPSDALCPSGQRCTSTGCTSSMSCTESPCRLVPPQCGCPSGQACLLNGGARTCGVAGIRAEGQSCTLATDCAAGLACLNFSAVGTAQMCVRMCATDLDCTGGGFCLGEITDATGATVPGVRTCTRACNPITQTGCATGLYCGVFRENTGAMRYLTDCAAPPGTGGLGTSCIDDGDCRGGYLCIDVGDGFPTCNPWCNVLTGTGCPGFTTCFRFMTPVVISGVEYGVCV